jgi:hypothetical protein
MRPWDEIMDCAERKLDPRKLSFALNPQRVTRRFE